MTYDVILLTDIQEKIWPAKPAGAYRLATELRKQGYSVTVLNHLSAWLENPTTLSKVLNKLIGANTLFVGVSSVFYNPMVFKQSYSYSSIPYYEKHDDTFYKTSKAFEIVNRQIRKLHPHVKWVLGGVNSEEHANNYQGLLDYLILGLADTTIVQLADHLKNNTSIMYMPSKLGFKVISHDLKAAGFDFPRSNIIYSEDDYVFPGEVLTLETSRGCLFRCDFCSYPLLGRKKGDVDYHKTVDAIAQEFSHNYEKFGTTNYMFVDDTFNETTEKLEHILQARDKSKVEIQFTAYLRADLLRRFPEQITLLKELGIISGQLGIETLYEPSAKSIGKSTKPEHIKETLYQIKDTWGTQSNIMGLFMVGLPYDNPDTLDTWIPWISSKECPIDGLSFSPLNIQPSQYPSLMSADPAKYGYTVTENGWTNQYWDYHQARDYAANLMDTLRANDRIRISGWDLLGLQNIGYTINDLRTDDGFLTLGQLDYKEIYTRKHAKIQEYLNWVCNTTL